METMMTNTEARNIAISKLQNLPKNERKYKITVLYILKKTNLAADGKAQSTARSPFTRKICLPSMS